MRRAVLLLMAVLALAAPVAAAPPVVTVERVLARPARRLPSGRALVRLSVVVKNRSADATLDGYGFRVLADGRELPAFHRTLFYGHPTAPGGEDTVRLYNFWAAGAGPHSVEVTLTEASRVRRDGRTTQVVGRVEAGTTRRETFRI